MERKNRSNHQCRAIIVAVFTICALSVHAQKNKLNKDSIANLDSIRNFMYHGTLLSMDALQAKYEAEKTNDIEVRHQKSVEAQNLFYQARILYRKTVKLDSNNYTAWSNMGTTYFLEDLPKEACYCFSQAVRINRGYSPAWFNLGKVYELKNRSDSAEFSFGMAIKGDSSYTQAYQEWSQLIMKERKDTSAALKLLRSSAHYRPESEVPWVSMSEIYFHSNDSLNGIHALEKAVKVYPGDIEHLQILEAYYKFHKDEKSAAYYANLVAIEKKKLEVKADEHPDE